MKKRLLKLFIIFLIILSYSDKAYCSAWTRKSNEIFIIFEFLNESNIFKSIINEQNKNYYKTNINKIYLEYGLLEQITIGGYIKNYNFYNKYYGDNLKLIKNINDDFYGNIFLIHNLYNINNNFFSLEYSFYFPIKYNDISKYVNTLDTKYAFELFLLYGKEGKVSLEKLLNFNINYFVDSSLSYKFSNHSYEQVIFATAVGIRLNSSSSFNLRYEYKYYLTDSFFTTSKNLYDNYNDYNSNQIKFFINYKFLDYLSTEFSFYKTFSQIDSTGVTFSFIFNFI